MLSIACRLAMEDLSHMSMRAGDMYDLDLGEQTFDLDLSLWRFKIRGPAAPDAYTRKPQSARAPSQPDCGGFFRT